MLIKITFPIIILLFCAGIASAQYFESVEKEAERILLSLSDEQTVYPTYLTDLKNLLSSDMEKDLSSSTPSANQQSIDSLTSHLAAIESELKNISTDSAFVLFNDWYLLFQNIFYEYSKEKFFASPKTKILLFSTSMSCYCTLKMCRNQTVDILKYVSENTDKYEYWIIDSYWHNELQIEYETLFAPSVIIFDGNNQVLYKLEYEEKMLTLLSDYFINIKN
jgi:hypothetical protein